MKMNDKVYDALCWVGKIVLPSLSVFYATLGKIWNLPYVEQIPLTIMAIDVLLNSLLGIANADYYKEQLKEDEGDIA